MLSSEWNFGGAVNLEVGLQQAKSERARAAICDATIASLAAVGYAETSINRVAAMADFSKGAVQYHFQQRRFDCRYGRHAAAAYCAVAGQKPATLKMRC